MRKKIATKLIKQFHTNCPFQIARELGVVILYEKFENTLGYFSNYKRIKIIHINQDLTELQQRFVCAHELGHSILHPEVNTPFLKKNTLFSISRIEREANEFAVELLLPDTLINELPDITLYQIAAAYGIPFELTSLKLQNSR